MKLSLMVGRSTPASIGFGVRFEPEVQIHRVIDVVAAGGSGGVRVFEDVVIDLDAVRLLSGRLLELSERGEALPVARPSAHRRFCRTRAPASVLIAYVAVRADSRYSRCCSWTCALAQVITPRFGVSRPRNRLLRK